MGAEKNDQSRIVPAVFGLKEQQEAPSYITDLAKELKSHYGQEGLIDLYGRFSQGMGYFDHLMRRIIWSGLARVCGQGLTVEPGVIFKHPETFTIGKGVFIGSQTMIQGRYDGSCDIGDHVWIGPGSYLDARALILGDHVGWGPGARILGSAHTGRPLDVPIITTDLSIEPVRVSAWADIGTNAVLLPGVTIGQGAIVGAGAVVTTDVPAFSVVAGVPSRFLHWRDGYVPEENEDV